MAMFHLTYPKRKGFVNWDELGCLSRALGFPRDTLLNNIPEETLKDQDGLNFKYSGLYSSPFLADYLSPPEAFMALFPTGVGELEKLCNQKYFHKALDRTFNHHTDDWNLCVIKKAVRLLSHKVLSFAELQNVRMAYQTYEAVDTKGMTLDQRTLLRSLKMCNRTIAPLKMMHRIKHMRENFDEPRRIQLYEYLDLILWCDLYEKLKLDDPVLVSGKDERDLFKLDNFAILLSHHDQRLALHLDEKYLKDEWNFEDKDDDEEDERWRRASKEPPVKTGIRTEQVRYHKRRYSRLRAEVDNSEKRVTHVHAGYVRGRPISAPDLVMYNTPEIAARESAHEARPDTVYSSIGDYIRCRMEKRPTHREVPLGCPRPILTEYQRPRNAEIVTKEEFTERGNVIESLYFEMETMDEKYHQMIEDDMEYVKPGFKERLAKRPKPATPSPPPEAKPKVEPRPSPEFLNFIGYAQPKSPLPSHARACDARFRGWRDVPHRKGHHFILASPTHVDSYQGRLFKSLREKADKELNRPFNDYIYRYTPRNQVLKEVRPTTAPELISSHASPVADDRRDKRRHDVGNTDATSGHHGSTGVLSLRADSEASSLSFTDFKMYKEEPQEKVYENEAEKRTAEAKEREEKNFESFLETKDSRESTPGSPQKDRRTQGSPQKDKRNANGHEDEKGAHDGEEAVCKRDVRGDVFEKIVSNVDDHGPVDRLEIFTPNIEYSKPKIVEMSKVGRITLLGSIIESTEAEETLEKAKLKQKRAEHPSESGRRINSSRHVSPTKMSIGHDGEVAESYIKQASQYLHKIAPKKYVKPKDRPRKDSTTKTKLQENKMMDSCQDSKRENMPQFRSHSAGLGRRTVPVIAVEDLSVPLRAAQIVLEVENWEPKSASFPDDPKKSYKRLIKRIEGNIGSNVEAQVMKSFTSSQNETLLGCA